MSQEKLQTMSMQNFGGVKEVHYGIVQVVNGEDNVFTFMLENNSAKRKAVSHCYNFLLFFLTCQLTS